MTKKFLISIVIVLAILVAGAYSYKTEKQEPPIVKFDPTVADTVKADQVLLNVPFTSQAPTANWKDPRQQDGCEEASITMAWLWIQNKTITPAEAEKTIIAMSEFEKDRYGNYLDLNAEDTLKLMKDYYGYQNGAVKINPSIEDINNTLREGKLVIVPANGQKLGNPHYKQPGPLTHMLVIKGFDDPKNQFITNDPGTRLGNNYKYSYDRVYNAMVDYPSGHHEDQTGRPKAMIVIQK